MITDISQLQPNKRYTYADYLSWQFSERVELLRGWPYRMSPAPRRRHQEVSGNIFGYIWSYLGNKSCKVYEAPFDVRLRTGNNGVIETVVQPDICVVCNLEKLDDRGCLGAPDLIVEVLSDSTAKKDYNEKYQLYEECGVKEYWIVNPDSESRQVFLLEEGEYHSIGIYNEIDGHTEVPVNIFPDLILSLKDLFA